MAEKQIHQLLAVLEDIKCASTQAKKDTKISFTYPSEFVGFDKTYQAKEEEGTIYPPDQKPLNNTVQRVINNMLTKVGKEIDTKVTLGEANRFGEAFIEIGDKSYGPYGVSTLMELESSIESLKSVYEELPTLDISKKWSKDSSAGDDVFISDTELTFRTEKKQDVKLISEPTEYQKAEWTFVTCDKIVGTWTTKHLCGAITRKAKEKILDNINYVLEQVKKAKSKANQQKYQNRELANSLFDYINKDLNLE